MENNDHSKKCAYVLHGNKDCDCDGYHTFGELYDHRIALYIALCRLLSENVTAFEVWRSRKHSDGELAFGGTWFVLGVGKEKGKQITYHLPIERWEDTKFAETLEKAPEWDFHSSDDALKRLEEFFVK